MSDVESRFGAMHRIKKGQQEEEKFKNLSSVDSEFVKRAIAEKHDPENTTLSVCEHVDQANPTGELFFGSTDRGTAQKFPLKDFIACKDCAPRVNQEIENEVQYLGPEILRKEKSE